ncbi:MAG: hypothetical protein J6O39_02285 [Treponema sp.]|nr:hypothetical protein [Treponema sp.]
MKNSRFIKSMTLAVMACGGMVITGCNEPESKEQPELFEKCTLPENIGDNPFRDLIFEDTATRFVFYEDTALIYKNQKEDGSEENEGTDNWQPSARYRYSYNTLKNQLYMSGIGFFKSGTECCTPSEYYNDCIGIYKSLFGTEDIPDTAKDYIRKISEKEFSTCLTFEYEEDGGSLALSYVPSCRFRTSKSDNYYGSDDSFIYDFYGNKFSFVEKKSKHKYIFVPEFNETNFSGLLLDHKTYLPEGTVSGKYSSVITSSEGRFKEGYTVFTFTEVPEILKEISGKKIKLNFFCGKKLVLTKISE